MELISEEMLHGLRSRFRSRIEPRFGLPRPRKSSPSSIACMHACSKSSPGYPDADLDLPPLKPHKYFKTRIAGLRYAPLHEMIHCGQIAIIRRMLGQKPIW